MKSNNEERDYIRALSRCETVEAYSKWNELSEIESLFLDKFVKKSSKIIDLGCGTGRIVKTLIPDKENYVGIDFSRQMIDFAIKNNPDYSFICDDILNYNSNFGTFDIALLMNNVVDMINPYERRRNLFKLCKKLLKNNGILIYSSHLLTNGNYAGYQSENYHGAIVHTYRAMFEQHCSEIEELDFEILMAARDYRNKKADWMYMAAINYDSSI
ncbi:MAG: class I SAM-dependent methyltransferase [Bacteroidetes bacterium]|nr:class I SAM-dependent methyltransferase [Bacteroidota bacterium]